MESRRRLQVEGRIFEFMVAVELLRRGFEVFMPVVDMGLDIIAIKEGRMFFIQAKKAKYQAERRRWNFQNIPYSEIDRLLKIDAEHSVALILGLESPERSSFNYLIFNRSQILDILPKIYHRPNPKRGESISIILEKTEDPNYVNLLLPSKVKRRRAERQRLKINNWADLGTIQTPYQETCMLGPDKS